MAKKDMDQPGTQQGGQRQGNIRDEERTGGSTDEVRGIANEEGEDEEFDDTEDLDDDVEESDEDFKA